jgi:hypothetical protein
LTGHFAALNSLLHHFDGGTHHGSLYAALPNVFGVQYQSYRLPEFTAGNPAINDWLKSKAKKE